MFGILGLLEVYKIPSILTQKAVEDREDSKHSNEDNASDENRVGDLWIWIEMKIRYLKQFVESFVSRKQCKFLCKEKIA